MRKKLHLVNIKGTNYSWGIRTDITKEAAQELRDDGFEVIEAYYIIPEWAFNLGVERLVMFIQDIFYLRNPFIK